MKKLITLMILAWLMLGVSCWAAYPNYTVCPSSCDFNTLNGAVNDIKTNHATLANNVTITISGNWVSADTATVNISGITPGSFTMLITATGAARTNGVYSTSAYRLAPSSGDGIDISNASDVANLTIDGIQIVNSNNTFVYSINLSNYQYNVTIENNVMVTSNQQGNACIVHNQPRGTNLVFNNVCYGSGQQYGDFWTAGSNTDGDGSTSVSIYNNTAYNIYDGIKASSNGGTFVMTNNVVLNCADACFYNVSAATSGSNNASSDTSASTSPLTSGLTGKTSYSSYFTSVSGNNFNLISGSPFIAQGANLSGTFTVDIAGTTRTVPWDMGAFKYTTASSSTPSTLNEATLNVATIN